MVPVISLINTHHHMLWPSRVTQTIKNMPAIQETQVRSLGRADTLEKRMANFMDRVSWQLQFMGSQIVRHNWATNTLHSTNFLFFQKELIRCTLLVTFKYTIY